MSDGFAWFQHVLSDKPERLHVPPNQSADEVACHLVAHTGLMWKVVRL